MYNQPLPDDGSAIGRKPIDEEEELEWVSGFVATLAVVVAVTAAIAVTIMVILKRRTNKRDTVGNNNQGEVVVRGLLVQNI